MATVIRIKRRLDEEPTESIFLKSKRSRREKAVEGAANSSSDETSVVLMRVGTVESKEEPIEPLVLRAIKKGWELRENYKKLGSGVSHRTKRSLDAKKRAVCKRYKIISQSRGFGELQQVDKDGVNTLAQKKDTSDDGKVDVEGAEASLSTSVELSYFDAVLANEMEDIITCNGVTMESEKYVYDVYYSTKPVKWDDVMERNMCRIEGEPSEMLDASESDSDERYDDEDDENEEGNWRNDYPDYDDSPCEDEEDYLNSQIRKCAIKHYDTDESYDQDDYEEEGFDIDGNLIMASSNPFSLSNVIKTSRLQDSSSDD